MKQKILSYLAGVALALTPISAMADDEAKLRGAREIVVDELVMNIGKDYHIKVDGDVVATVSGKNLKLWADEFRLTTSDGNLLAYEQERKRIFSFNRGAEIYDGEGNTVGFLAERTFRDFFRPSYVFHFLDENGKELGESAKLTNSRLGKHVIYDAQGNVDYRINKHFWAIAGDAYTITVEDPNSGVPLEHVILLTCIEDAIGDSNDD